MENGYIKLHRSLLDNPICCKDPEYFAVWMYLLLNSTHTQKTAMCAGEKINLLPGQLISGRQAIGKFWNISASKVERILTALQNEDQITQKTSRQGRLISIANWEQYQQKQIKTKKQNIESNKKIAESADTIADLFENIILTNEKEKPIKKVKEQNPEYLKIINDFINKKLTDETFKNSIYLKNPDVEQWAIEIDKLIRLDKYTQNTIIEVLDYSLYNQFWSNQIVSLASIRKKSKNNGLSKFENCRLSMETEKNYKLKMRR